jgi:hypothetical protein
VKLISPFNEHFADQVRVIEKDDLLARSEAKGGDIGAIAGKLNKNRTYAVAFLLPAGLPFSAKHIG